MGLDAVIAALQAVAISIEHGALKPPAYQTEKDITSEAAPAFERSFKYEGEENRVL